MREGRETQKIAVEGVLTKVGEQALMELYGKLVEAKEHEIELLKEQIFSLKASNHDLKAENENLKARLSLFINSADSLANTA